VTHELQCWLMLSAECMWTDAFLYMRKKCNNCAENVRHHHTAFSPPGDQDLYTLALMCSSLQNIFHDKNVYSASYVRDAWRKACRSSWKVLLLSNFNQNWKVMTILVYPLTSNFMKSSSVFLNKLHTHRSSKVN
jgi:hypothetical protein